MSHLHCNHRKYIMRIHLPKPSIIYAIPKLDSSNSMADPNSNYTRFFIKNVNGYLLYHLPQTDVDWYTWECDMCDRETERDTMLFQDGESYWSLICYSGYWGGEGSNSLATKQSSSYSKSGECKWETSALGPLKWRPQSPMGRQLAPVRVLG